MKSTCFVNTNTNEQNPLKHVDSIRSFKNLNFVRMKALMTFILLFVLGLGFSVYGQDNSCCKQMIATIDSISTANDIKTGQVVTLKVTSSFGSTDTGWSSITQETEFRFDGQFLVIENKYFNMNKLLYFYTKEGTITFVFQGY